MLNHASRTWPRLGQLGQLTSGVAFVLALGNSATMAQEQPTYKNLQVLPADISRGDLNQIMLDNLQGLGLPRRSGEGCLYCHMGSTDVPRSEWDYASDEKQTKKTARVMLAMVRDINTEHLTSISERMAPSLEVSCYTCHAGRTNPTPLHERLVQDYEVGDFETLENTYREARALYYESDTYDFRVHTLTGVANEIAQLGHVEDAARVHELNIEHHDGPDARGGLIRLRLLQALEIDGPSAMIQRYHELKSEQPTNAFTPFTIDSLAWRLQRSEQQDAAMLLFELNYTEHPGAFGPMESLAYAVSAAGDPERGMKMAKDWIAANPDHKGGQQLLMELQR